MGNSQDQDQLCRSISSNRDQRYFQKISNKYEGLLTDICENLNNLDDPEAKASIVWIIGEYIEIIDNADELMANFVENFKDEPDVVQQQILTSCMKLYLLRPEDGQ